MPEILPSWDETTRPAPSSGEGTPAEDRRQSPTGSGDHLRMIHAAYRQGLEQVGAVIAVMAEDGGAVDVAKARAVVHSLGLRATMETMGALCGRMCQAVDSHHRIEDAHLYPALRRADQRLVPLLDRLHEEHDVIHAMLVHLDDALVRLAGTEEGSAGQREAARAVAGQFAHLQALLLSHFAYEESAICAPLSTHGILV